MSCTHELYPIGRLADVTESKSVLGYEHLDTRGSLVMNPGIELMMKHAYHTDTCPRILDLDVLAIFIAGMLLVLANDTC